jgi:hypothetical protein
METCFMDDGVKGIRVRMDDEWTSIHSQRLLLGRFNFIM